MGDFVSLEEPSRTHGSNFLLETGSFRDPMQAAGVRIAIFGDLIQSYQEG